LKPETEGDDLDEDTFTRSSTRKVPDKLSADDEIDWENLPWAEENRPKAKGFMEDVGESETLKDDHFMEERPTNPDKPIRGSKAFKDKRKEEDERARTMGLQLSLMFKKRVYELSGYAPEYDDSEIFEEEDEGEIIADGEEGEDHEEVEDDEEDVEEGEEEEGLEWEEGVDMNEPNPELRPFHRRIREMCSGRKPDAALRVLGHISKQGLEPDVSTYKVLIRSLCRSGFIDQAVAMFESVVDRWRSWNELSADERATQKAPVQPSMDYYRLIVKELCKAKRPREAYKYVIEARDNPSHSEPVRNGYFLVDSLVAGYLRSGDLDNALNTLEEFADDEIPAPPKKRPQLRQLEESTDDYDLHDDLAAQSAAPSLVPALDIKAPTISPKRTLYRMRPSIESYNAVIRFFGKARRSDGVFKVLSAMAPIAPGVVVDARERRVKPDDTTYEMVVNALVRSCELIKHVDTVAQLPEGGKPEVCFMGLSNVGKSSLVNLIVGRKALAFKSMKPGTTTRFNFYDVNDKFFLVDCPGLGYAEVGPRLIESWERFINGYIRDRKELKYIFHLIDGRSRVAKEDLWIMSLVAAKQTDAKYVICLTKCDKLPHDAARNWAVRNIQEALTQSKVKVEDTTILLTSAVEKWGRLELWNFLEDVQR